MNSIRLILFSLLVCYFSNLNAQLITTNGNYNPQELVENFLIDGCIQVSNVISPVNGSINGINSFGYFEQASSSFPFPNGIVMSTGKIEDAGNTLLTSNLNEGTNTWSGDTDMENTLPISNTINATVLEFDLISTKNTLSFNYILASEEYINENPCNHSDYFACLIKPSDNSAPYTNIALVPDTDSLVGTGTIHPQIIGFCDAQNESYFLGYNIEDTNYNGRTKILYAATSITPNTSYHIKLIISDTDDHNLDSSVFIKANSFNTNFSLGNDVATCQNSHTIQSGISNPGAVFHWYLNDELLTESQPALTATQSGEYKLVVEVPLNGSMCARTDSISVSLNELMNVTPMTNYGRCDGAENDGTTSFYLPSKNQQAINSISNPGNYTVSYYASEEDALNNANPLPNNYTNTSNPQTIYVKIEDTSTGCTAINSFNLVVNPSPDIPEYGDYVLCNFNNETLANFNLVPVKNFYSNLYPGSVTKFYLTPEAAQQNTNPLPDTYMNVTNPQTIYVRMENTGSCPAYSQLTLQVANGPQIATDNYTLTACSQDPQFTTFNLNDALDEILATPDNPDYNINFYLSYNNAVNNINPISNPSSFTNTIAFEQTIYISVTNTATGSSCSTIADFQIITNPVANNMPGNNFYKCDEPENDGFTDFSLVNIANYLSPNQSSSITFYPTQADLVAGTNAYGSSDIITNTSNPQIIYAHLENDEGCYYNTPVNLIVNPYFSADPSNTSFTFCSPTASTSTSIDLHSFDSELIGSNNYEVFYYTTMANALANTSPVNFPVNNTNPVVYYAKIRENSTYCTDIVEIEVLVHPAPSATTPGNIFHCDDDNNGIATINLTTVIPQTVADTSNRDFEFYLSYSNAQNGVNEIENPGNYETDSKQVYIKVINTVTGCYSIRSFSVYVSYFNENLPFSEVLLCEDDNDGFEQVILAQKDNAILSGTVDNQVRYFETLSNAENNIDPISKYTPYTNTSNPQVIYVRVQNVHDNSCYKTFSFELSVKEYPQFTMPDNLSICDDVTGTGTGLFDFTPTHDNIINSASDTVTVGFYTSEEFAIAETNELPLQYTNITNPQTIYTRVTGANGCFVVFPLTLNVISLLDFDPPPTYYICDNNNDGIVSIDLTDDSLGILPERLDNLEVQYYYSFDEAEQEVNQINNPEFVTVYQGTTFYIKLKNTISDCYFIYPFQVLIRIRPEIIYTPPIKICDTPEHTILLPEYNSLLASNPQNYVFTYYSSQDDAELETNALAAQYTYTVSEFTLYVRITDPNEACITILPVQFKINPLPQAYQPDDITLCSETPGKMFDLRSQSETILGGQDPNIFGVTYFTSETDANANTNAVASPGYFTITDGIEVFARVTNSLTGCYQVTSFSGYIQLAPVIPLEGEYYLCEGETGIILDAFTGNNTDSFLWSTGSEASSIFVSEPGILNVTVTAENGCWSQKYVHILQSESATVVNVVTTGFSDDNTIMVTAIGNGNYLYSLDGSTPQSSPSFSNVPIGYHTVTVTDQNGCSPTVVKNVVIFGFPAYFTPNGDGVNDTWNIFGFEYFENSEIQIFDRFGKFVKVIRPGDNGWDGTYKGAMLPSSDYWFVAYINDFEVLFEHRGHFALKR